MDVLHGSLRACDRRFKLRAMGILIVPGPKETIEG